MDEARASVRAALALNPAYSIARARDDGAKFLEDEAASLTESKANFKALRQAGVSEP